MTQKMNHYGSSVKRRDGRLGSRERYTMPIVLPCRSSYHEGYNGSWNDPGRRHNNEQTKD